MFLKFIRNILCLVVLQKLIFTRYIISPTLVPTPCFEPRLQQPARTFQERVVVKSFSTI